MSESVFFQVATSEIVNEFTEYIQEEHFHIFDGNSYKITRLSQKCNYGYFNFCNYGCNENTLVIYRKTVFRKDYIQLVLDEGGSQGTELQQIIKQINTKIYPNTAYNTSV